MLDTIALKMHVQTSPAHTHTHTHRAAWLVTFKQNLSQVIATHRFSPSKMGSSYHTLVLDYKDATPQVICAIAFSAGLNGLQVDKL